MHSPESVAFEIKNPFIREKDGYRPPLITIWHNDPEKDGTDDSCGWFMRSRHGHKNVLDNIKKQLDMNFDSIFVSDSSGKIYNTGNFKPDGTQNMSTIAITLDLFYKAAYIFFKRNRNKTQKWMNKNLFQVLHFAENQTDSLYADITGQFRGDEPWNREYAISNYASIIYGWLLRETRPWYKHPRWHIHHWSLQIHPLQNLKRRYWDKCCICGKRGFKSYAMSDWNGTKRWHQECDITTKISVTEKTT